MPTHGPVPWAIAPHTAAKHQIYATYLRDWFEILMRGQRAFRFATYAEGFAGPGVYSTGELGSPVLAVKALIESPKLAEFTREGKFVFVDDDHRCIGRLIAELTDHVGLEVYTDPATRGTILGNVRRARSDTPVRIVEGSCADHLETALDAAGAWGQPIFANLDSWGNAPVPYRLLKRIAENKAGEVIVTLAPQHFIRFVETAGERLDEVFGHVPDWRQLASQEPGNKRRFVLTKYREALARAGFQFILDFELKPVTGDSLYLVFGTNNRKGLATMKRALWDVDPTFGVGFRDPRDDQGELLFNVSNAQDAPLQRFLAARLSAGPEWVPRLRDAAVLQTVYRETHVLPAVEKMVSAGRLQVVGGGPVRLGSRVELIRPLHSDGL